MKRSNLLMMLCFSNFNRGLQYRQRRISHIILRHINNIYKPTYLISYQIGSKSGGTQFPLFYNVAICTCFHLRLRILFYYTTVVFVYIGILSKEYWYRFFARCYHLLICHYSILEWLDPTNNILDCLLGRMKSCFPLFQGLEYQLYLLF